MPSSLYGSKSGMPCHPARSLPLKSGVKPFGTSGVSSIAPAIGLRPTTPPTRIRARQTTNVLRMDASLGEEEKGRLAILTGGMASCQQQTRQISYAQKRRTLSVLPQIVVIPKWLADKEILGKRCTTRCVRSSRICRLSSQVQMQLMPCWLGMIFGDAP